MRRKTKVIIYLLFFIGIIIFAFVIQTFPKDDYTVTFVDVGQGDCSVIKSKNNCVLVDAGTRKDARAVRIALDRLSVKSIDAIVLSHLDSDHISGTSRLINDYEVKKIITSETDAKYLPESTDVDELNTALELKNIPLKKVKSGDSFKAGDIGLSVLSPCKEYSDSNKDSAVVRVTLGKRSLMFTGDITSDVEADIINNHKNISSDILKAAHHGSRTSTSGDFLNAVNPSFSVVSVSDYNTYNLPNLETMNRLYGYGCKVYRTDEMGDITFHFKNGKIDVETEKA